MRVKIGYGMELEEIPELAEDLGYKAHLEIKEAAHTLQKAIENIEESEGDYTLVLEMLDKVRNKLNRTDLIISDTEAILQGLHNYHNGVKNVSEGRPTVDPSGDTITETEDTGEG